MAFDPLRYSVALLRLSREVGVSAGSPPSSDPGPCLWGAAQGASGRSRRECRPRAFASSGERTRAISVALSQSSQRIVTSAPPPEHVRASPFGTGSEDPQSGQVRPLSRAIPAARRLCWSESRTLPVYSASSLDAPDGRAGMKASREALAARGRGNRRTARIHWWPGGQRKTLELDSGR